MRPRFAPDEVSLNNHLSLSLKTGFFIASAYFLASGARADVKMVSEVSLTGNLPITIVANAPTKNSDGLAEPLRPDATYTTYYKGKKARRESDGGSLVVIYDRENDKVYTISPQAKKYYVVSFKEALENGSGLPGPIAESMNLITGVDLDDPAPAADRNRTIAGKDATKLTLFGSVTAGPKSANSPGFKPASGAFSHNVSSGGAGSASSGDDPTDQTPLPLLGRSTLNGSLWVADIGSVMPGGKKDEAEMSFALLQLELPAGCPILRSLTNQIGKKKCFPLGSKIIVRTYEPSGGGVSASDPGGSGFSLASADSTKSLTITTEVKSIDTGLTLDDSLFQLPSGLEKVDPPSPITPLPIQSTSDSQ